MDVAEQHANASGDRRVNRDDLDDDTKLEVESPTCSPPPTPSRKQLPTSSSPAKVESEDQHADELQGEQHDQQHPLSPAKQAMAMDMEGYESAQENSMIGDDMEDRAANGTSRPASNGQDRNSGSFDRDEAASPEKYVHGGPSYTVDTRDEHPIRIRQAEGETNQYSDEDDHNQSMMSQTTASAAKPKGKGRGKAAFPKGGENTPASAYTGHKIKHLKKEDGEPLWRKDIQYDFLDYIFRNDVCCFTNSYEPEMPKQCFADLYIDTMARSSKTSKILREKLMSEREPAKNMAMVCLLVNLGRMNTTLNFFPEMRAQLRTYHAIPSLQAQQDPNSYKQLQDAPRLKSILKGASEDRLEPNTIDKIKDIPIPRTNPVNLIFVLAQYASRVTELHFPPGRDFYDLIMRPTLSSESRGGAFLWLMWHYLESDFTEEGCNENPFGAGVDYQTGVSNQGVPELVSLTEPEAAKENVDTPYEIEYGEEKKRERRIIIEADQAVLQRDFGPPKRGPKPKLNLEALAAGGDSPGALLKTNIRNKYDDDGADSARSTPPRGFLPPGHRHKIGGVRVPAHVKYRLEESSPAPLLPSPTPHLAWEHPARRQRPLTAHQQAVEKSRNEHVNHILNKGLKNVHSEARQLRKTEGAILRAVQRTAVFQSMCEDSEDEENLKKHPGVFRERGMGGLVQVRGERDDFGEECGAYGMALRRLGRRLRRWDDEDEGKGTGRKERRAERQRREDEQDRQDMLYETPRASNGNVNGNSQRDEVEDGDEDLDDVDKTLLGLDGGEEEDEAADEDLDDVDKALLGLGGDESDGDEDADRMDVS